MPTDRRHHGDGAAAGGDAFNGAALAWTPATPATSPGARYCPSLTYFPERGSIMMYGGTAGASPLDDLWEYAGGTWTQRCAVCPPGARTKHGLVYDPARGVVVLYGGATSSNDLWELDSSLTWVQRSPSGSPPPPSAGAYVARRGGRIAVYTGDERDFVYEYDGAAWVGPLGSAGPHRPVHDAAVTTDGQGRMLVYGGHTTVDYTDELWAWDGVAWSLLCDACTGTARGAAALAFDPRRGLTLIIGGFIGTDPEMSGTWEGTTSFALVDAATPYERDCMGVAYDPVRDVLVGFGGNGTGCGDLDCDETWEYRRVR